MEDRWNVVRSRKDGMSYAAMQRKFGYTRDFIARWWRRYQETGGVDDAPRSGRPKALTPVQRREVARSLKRKATSSLRSVAKRMKTEHDVIVSKDTIQRVAIEEGLVYRRRKKKPRLTDAHREARRRFARRRRPRGFWDRVMWCDEASFALYSLTKGEWIEAGEEPAPHETVKWPPRIRVWAAISSRGKTPLVRIPKKMNATEYETLLVEKLIPLMRDIFDGSPDDFVFMQDGDGCHTAKKVRNRLDLEGIEQLYPWPAHSPDLNPIENVWSIVERHLETVHPTSDRGLWDAMKEAWDKIDNDQLLRLCGSLPRRLQAVKEAQGGHTKY
jgi:transposase